MQMDPSAGIEEEYHHKSNRVSLISAMLFTRLLIFFEIIYLMGSISRAFYWVDQVDPAILHEEP